MDTKKLIKDSSGMIKTGQYTAVNPNSLSPEGYQMALSFAQSQGSTLPSQQDTSSNASNLPTGTGASGSLLDFKSSLQQAINLAKQKRNSLSLDFMKPFSGTVAASDFNSILNNFNSASDTFSNKVVEAAVPTKKDTSITEANGRRILIDNQTGNVIQDLGMATSSSSPTPPPVVSTNPDGSVTVTPSIPGNEGSEIQAAVTQFQTKMKQLGWRGVNPDDYQKMADYFQSTYGTGSVAKLKTAMNAVGLKVDNGTGGFQ